MNAGRVIDALVAEKVMGLIKCTNKAHEIDKAWCHARPESDNRGGETQPYSTSISAAWEAVGKLRHWPDGHWWLHLSQVAGVQDNWEASFTFGGMAARHPRHFTFAPTAPLAICRAALKVISTMPVTWEELVKTPEFIKEASRIGL